MQNEPNFRKSQMYVNKVLTKEYVNWTLGQRGENEPNSNPISKAKTVGFYGYFLARDRQGRQGGLTVYGKSEFIFL